MLITVQFTAPIKLNFIIENQVRKFFQSRTDLLKQQKPVFQEFPGKISKKLAAIYELLVGKYQNIVIESCWSHFKYISNKISLF